jgi:hypothetical protein
MMNIVQWTRRTAMVVLLAGVLAACGGGGYGGTTAAPQPASTSAQAFVLSGLSNRISGFRVDSASGTLRSVGTVNSGRRTPMAVAAHPSGRHAYLLNHDSSDISRFDVDPATGARAPGGVPTLLQSRPDAMLMRALAS